MTAGDRAEGRAQLPEGTVVDATFMSAAALEDFLAEEIEKTKAEGVLFSLHMKATMMKVSDPIIFGHAVKAWLAPVFEKYGDKLDALGVNRQRPRRRCWRRSRRARDHGRDRRRDGRAPADVHGRQRPGITNLHVPSDVIIDASMPALIRAAARAGARTARRHDAKCCVIPDNCYAGL
jgi:isocitrate dehydrogenase